MRKILLFLVLESLMRLSVHAQEEESDISKYLPFDMPPYEELIKSPKKVFPHWHLFNVSWDNKDPENDFYNTKVVVEKSDYEQKGRERPLPRPVIPSEDWKIQDIMHEIRLAKAIGSDAFWMNHLGQNNQNLEQMLEAAKRVNSPFKILIAPDAVSYGKNARKPAQIDSVDRYVSIYGKYGKNPFVYRYENKVVISGFASHFIPPEKWGEIRKKLKEEAIETYFVPLFMGWKKCYLDYRNVADGFSDWGSSSYTSPSKYEDGAKISHDLGKIWMMPIRPQEVRVKNAWYNEAKGSELLRNGWMSSINSGADWVQLVTWNDYGEGTEIIPSTGIQYAYYDLCAYYTVWFKMGKAPNIVRDVLYYFHRTQFSDAKPAQGGKFKVQQGAKAEDIIELLGFLKEPGTLQIEIGGKVFKKEAPAGVTSFQVPLQFGTPKFSLTRGENGVVSVQSAFPILDKPVKVPDLLYKAGSTSRKVVPMTELYRRFYDE